MKKEKGFTLLEILIVIMIMGMIAGMAWPSIGMMDDAEKTRITLKKMDEIRDAVIGRPDLRDSEGNRIVGGFVGDMKRWPFLWEARAYIKEDYAGTGWSVPSSMTEKLGQFSGFDADGHPLYDIDLNFIIPRPTGVFEAEKWKWVRPFRRLTELAASGIGDTETENEGQPRELWTKYPEELPFDLAGDHKAPGYTLDDRWKGPYLIPPADKTLQDGDHYARTDSDYFLLEPVWHYSGIHQNAETWTEGCYSPVDGELGEKFDDKERFRLLQTDGRLSDGWGRAFRFFITADTSDPGETIFWILSEGPDMDGVYPSRGICDGSADPDDVMGKAYDPDLKENRDNIVLKLSSSDWKALFADDRARRESRTRNLMEMLAASIVSSPSSSVNTGYSADMLSWPDLYNFEDGISAWDEKNDSNVKYVSGQPRGLWTMLPSSGDNLPSSVHGVGWRSPYFPAPPVRTGSESLITDSWGRPFMFFRDAEGMMILSKGSDGRYTFGNPDDPAEAVTISSYLPSASGNADNLVRTIPLTSWLPGYFTLPGIRIHTFSSIDYGKLRVRLCGVLESLLERKDPVLKPGTDGILKDSDSDGTPEEWLLGEGTSNAFHYDDSTSDRIVAGSRFLLIWEDKDDNGEFGSGEKGWRLTYDIKATPAGMTASELDIDVSRLFTVLP